MLGSLSFSSVMLPDTDNFNVIFVNAVEDYPAIYDFTRKEYSNKDEQEKSWKALAQKFNSTDAECKGRWKHLRGGLARYMKKRTGDKAKKPFYLWDVMQFVVPYMKSRPQSGSLPDVNQPHNDDTTPAENIHDEEDTISEEGKTIDDTDPQTPLSMSGTSSAGSSKLSWKRKAPPDEFEKLVSEYIASKTETRQNNPDLDFFKSILPDIADFSPSKKRKFKTRVLQVIEELSFEDDSAPREKNSERHVRPPPPDYPNQFMPTVNESQDQPPQFNLQSYYNNFL